MNGEAKVELVRRIFKSFKLFKSLISYYDGSLDLSVIQHLKHAVEFLVPQTIYVAPIKEHRMTFLSLAAVKMFFMFTF